MGEFVEESGVPAKEAENGDGEAEELLLVGEESRGEIAVGAAMDGVLEEAGSFEIGLRVDDVVEAPVLRPFEADLCDRTRLGMEEATRGGGGTRRRRREVLEEQRPETA